MKTNASSSLSSQFAAWRKRQTAASLGAVAVLSLANLRSAEKEESADTARRVSETVAAISANDSNTEDDETRGAISRFAAADETAPHGASVGAYLLTPGERAALRSARPDSRAVIFRVTSAPVAAASEPLPEGFTPAPVADFEPAAVQLSAEELAAIDSESAAEIAAIDAAEIAAARVAYANAFRSDYAPKFAPVDYAPRAVSFRAVSPALAVPAPVAAVTSAAPVAGMDFEALRLAVLAGSKRRK